MGMNIAVFCSGNGTNFQAIIDAAKTKEFDANIAIMICDNKQAHALERAKKGGIKTLLVLKENFKTREDLENKIITQLENEKIGLICLAGFMRILSPEFIKIYENKILNIHPALLPDFKGAHGIKDAHKAGVTVTGVTVHFVTEELDSGPVILQEKVKIGKNESLKNLEEKIHKVEHKLYPEAVRMFVDEEIK